MSPRRPTMLRPAEQIKQEIEQKIADSVPRSMGGNIMITLNAVPEMMHLRDGDEATGLQILAGLPMEEQDKFLKHMQEVAFDENSEKKPCVNDYASYANCGYLGCDIRCIADWLETKFVYRSGKWEVKGEK
jgi:hypothetical protein